MTISFDEFMKVEIRVGTIVAAEPFPEARRPALKLTIDFGSKLGIKRSSAQLTGHYDAASLMTGRSQRSSISRRSRSANSCPRCSSLVFPMLKARSC